MKVQSLVFYLVAAHTVAAAAAVRPLVNHGVRRQLEQTSTVDIVVTMRKSPQEAFESLQTMTFPTRGAKIAHLVERLETLATTSQRDVDQILTRESATSQPLYESEHLSWSTNRRYIKGATFELVMALAEVPEIEEIREEEVGLLADVIEESTPAASVDSIQWGVKRIEADKVWLNNVTGQGVVVGSIDTGARPTHELLRDSFRGDYGWYAPFKKDADPYDIGGHGSHTIGTMTGAGGIGVAPGAKWMACLGCPFSCLESALVLCGEWMLCPTDRQGKNKDCSKAPDVINCSWYIPKKDVYKPVISAWREASIIPVFAQGNSGPECGTVVSPGDYPDVIGVGNINVDNSLSSFSSRGPTVNGVVKPDISAPGSDILSAGHKNDTALVLNSGTSMAAPHVVGAIALLLSAQPNLTYNEIYSLLTSTADQENVDKNITNCDNTTELQWPNSNYGYGIMNVLNAYRGQHLTPLPAATATPTYASSTESPVNPSAPNMAA